MAKKEALKMSKIDKIEFRKKKMTKQKSTLKSIKSQNVSSYYNKNSKVIAIYLMLIVIVIIEIIAKMIVMVTNKNNNK